MSEHAPYVASFNPLVRRYMLIYVAWMLLITVVFSPLILIWVLGPGQWWAAEYFRKLKCVLDDKVLSFRKGILFQVEKTIPLENIQDVTFIEGPLLRQFNLSLLRIETAGMSQGQAHTMQLVGIVDAHALRAEILRRRDRLRAPQPLPSDASDRHVKLLEEIRDRLDDIAGLLRKRADPAS
ncbi:MAG: PH domain-containing protein [Xanthomonadaceae bacterium]|nr:PH domain-containing protein [Xanthomonadaceae bacterium]